MNMQQLNAMIPLELKAKPNWVGHINKIPMDLITGYPARTNDKVGWLSYNEAIKYCNGYDGLGFMFESPYVGIDLDDCIENGKLNPFASSIINATSSYTEYSPSKTGIHIICKGKLPAPIKTPTLEVYQTGRYFTMTGDRISSHSLLRQIDDFSFLYPNGYNIPKKLNERINSIEEGNRNNTLTGIAGSLRAKGYSSEEIFELLKPKAKEIGFAETELWAICKSMGRYAPNITSMPHTTHGESVESFLADREEVRWICKPFIAEQAIGFIAGLPESRKSWILIDLAIEAAKGGGLWLNKFPVKGAKVLLIDQERSKSEVQRRLTAVISAKEMSVTSIQNALFVRCGTTTRIDLQHSYDALRKEIADIRPDLILIDSFATFHTKNESNRAEIQQVMERIKDLRNEFKCAIIMIHHETKQAYQNKKDGAESSYLDMAGNVAIPAAAEFCMNVVKQDAESSFCHHTKSTQGSKQASFLVKVTDVDGPSKIRVEAF